MHGKTILVSALALLAAGGLAVGTTSGSVAQSISAERVQLALNPVVRDIQSGLNAQGYDAGPVDGLMGSRTRHGIEAYQRDNGLLVTGQPSASLLEHIEASLDQRQGPPPATPSDRDLVAQIQSELRQRGYPIDTVDGQMDAATGQAIRAYERASGLAVTGRASLALLAHLERGPARDPYDGRSRADRVRFAQERLNLLGYEAGPADGVMGPRTRSALRAFQREADLPVTGELDRDVLAQLRRDGRQERRDGEERLTMTERVRIVQQELNARGYDAGPADGVLGPKTRSAIRTYQSDAGEPVTGQVTAALVDRLQSGNGHRDRPGDDGRRDRRDDDRQQSRWIDRLDDDFDDGNYASSPRWTVHAGRFAVRAGALVSEVEPRRFGLFGGDGNGTGSAEGPQAEELGRVILTTFLESLIADESEHERREAAEISTRFDLGNAFRMRVRISVNSPAGQFAVGPYQSWNRRSGYRLAFDGSDGTLRLLTVTSQGARVVASRSGLAGLADGKIHELDLQRFPDGRMIAIVDGRPVLEARDGTFGDPFNGVTFANLNGAVALHAIRAQEAA
jgi:peptidoglycan hydrolase-like protein with peptidoglycan-binding domain